MECDSTIKDFNDETKIDITSDLNDNSNLQAVDSSVCEKNEYYNYFTQVRYPLEKRISMAKSEVGEFGFRIEPNLVHNLTERVQFQVGNKPYRNGVYPVTVLLDGLPCQIYTPWLTVVFEMKRYPHETNKRDKDGMKITYYKYSVTTEGTVTYSPTDPNTKVGDPNYDRQVIFFNFLNEIDRMVLAWGTEHFDVLYSESDRRKFKNSMTTISELFQPVIRKSKDTRRDPTLKISFPVSQYEIRMNEEKTEKNGGVFIYNHDTHNMEPAPNFKPIDLLTIKKNVELNTAILIDKVWAANDMWGISAQARDQAGFKFPPQKEWKMEEPRAPDKKRKRSRSRDREHNKSKYVRKY